MPQCNYLCISYELQRFFVLLQLAQNIFLHRSQLKAHQHELGKQLKRDGNIFASGPRFDASIPQNVTVQEGQTAILSCRVLNLAEKNGEFVVLFGFTTQL